MIVIDSLENIIASRKEIRDNVDVRVIWSSQNVTNNKINYIKYNNNKVLIDHGVSNMIKQYRH